MAGRPKGLPFLRQRRAYKVAGRYQQRLDSLHAKRQKVEMLETLISEHEKQSNPDIDYIHDLKKRANECRSQLRVLSTIEPDETFYD